MTRILYVIQTFKAPEQIYRLAQIIKTSSPASSIIICHDYTVSHLEIEPLEKLEVEVLRINGKGGRGDFSMVQSYLEAIEWALTHNLEFDWCINLSGQDYPTQPLPQLEHFLAKTFYDGFLDYFEAFSETVGIERERGSILISVLALRSISFSVGTRAFETPRNHAQPDTTFYTNQLGL
jgi:hypothetical protein